MFSVSCIYPCSEAGIYKQTLSLTDVAFMLSQDSRLKSALVSTVFTFLVEEAWVL